MYSTPCNTQAQQLASRANYNQGDFVIPTINAVYAIAEALHETLVEKCGKDYEGPCQDFMQSDDAYSRY